MRIFYAAGFLLGTAALTIAGRPTQNDRLRAERDAALRDVYRLAKLLDNMRVDLSRAEAMLQHPSSQDAAGASRDDLMDLCDVLTIGDALLELDAVETVGDILWLTGGES